MQRFIQYLYEYKGGKPVRNVGFIKVEEKRDTRMVHIHGKGVCKEKQEAYIYLCYVDNGRCVGVLCGKDKNVNPAINYRLEYGRDDIGRASGLDAVKGIVIRNEAGDTYGALWGVGELALDTMQEEKKDILPEAIVSEDVEEVVEISEEAEPEEVQYQLIEEMESEGPTEKYEKIRRQDLSRLPRREWMLANNRFLLHGYHNYHHLLLIEDEGGFYLGVPGIYHPREETAARAFGFREFRRVGAEQLGLGEAEKNDYDDFGYWCRQVERIRV